MSIFELQREGFASQRLAHQFEEINQQNECYIVGMWTFLVTEIMFFGALFLILSLYRMAYPASFEQAHAVLLVSFGLTNAVILISGSYFMTMCVRAKMLGDYRMTQLWLGLTLLCACGFLVVKSFEYASEFKDHHFPGPSFHWETTTPGAYTGSYSSQFSTTMPANAVNSAAVSSTYSAPVTQNLNMHKRQLFFSLYFIMTGLHAVHVIIGILIMGTLFFLIRYRHPSVDDYMPVEVTGLDWHFVDIVWIFLFPLLYLIGKQ